ncbi:succinylglutamate desuccinylase [Sphingorhabdus lutea]|uniref:Succinylglutamate desuccinylase n=1 Tax=Sphingorhabdus lutea TaxID=1913578 RepID=A0A1L3JF94_9SPHN|nr:succinylglutamate desuccinylase [Sphingorhabdus lutea]
MPKVKAAPFIISGESIAPGTARRVALPVSDLSAGMQANLEVHVVHGRYKGPTIFISAAIHGDEITGTEIIRRVIAKLRPKALAGTILCLPVVNMFGFIAQQRYLPDRRDLNRCFPGSKKGSLGSQLAYIFTSEIVDRCSLGIDIHSAAQHRYNLPQIRIDAGSERLAELAKAFAPPAIIVSALRDGSLRAMAKERGVEMLLMEAGEALRIDDFSVNIGVIGIFRVLQNMGMIKTKRLGKVAAKPARAKGSFWLRASRGGLCKMLKTSGNAVKKGEVIAEISDIFGECPEELTCPADGLIIGHSNLPIVNQGDALFHIAEVKLFDDVEERIEKLSDAIFSETLLDEDELL